MLGTPQLQCPRGCRLVIFPSPSTEPLYFGVQRSTVSGAAPRHCGLYHNSGLPHPVLFLSQPPPCNNPPREQQGHNLPERRDRSSRGCWHRGQGHRALHAAHLILWYCFTRKARLRRTWSTIASMWPGQNAEPGGHQAIGGSHGPHWALPTFGSDVVTHGHHCNAP